MICIHNTLDHTTACIVAESVVHSKLDYWNSISLNISSQQAVELSTTDDINIIYPEHTGWV